MDIKEIKETQWGGHLSFTYKFISRYAYNIHPNSYRRVKEIFDEAFTWHEQQVEEGYLSSFGGQPYSPENRQALAHEVYNKMAKLNHHFPQIVDKIKIITDYLGRNADKLELK